MGFMQPTWSGDSMSQGGSDFSPRPTPPVPTQTGVLSKRTYMFLVTMFTAAGIAFAAAFSLISLEWDMKAWHWAAMLGFFLGVLAVGILGIWIAHSSDNPLISSIGYAIVAGAMGLMMGPFVNMYTTVSVFRILALTTLIVVVLGVIGAMWPGDLASWGKWLLGALIIVIVATLAVPLLGFFGLPTGGAMLLIDWIAIFVFAGFVIYDLNKAVRLEFTVDNAIDSALNIFLDFINLFIRLLEIFGQKK